MKPFIILDGVTGAGKSSVLKELMRLADPAPAIILEDITLGAIMDQIRDPDWCAKPTFEGLDAGLAAVHHHRKAQPEQPLIVERFHLTAHALFPNWALYEPYDDKMRELGAFVVLLTYPDERAAERSIDRPDRENWAEGMAEWYGSRAKAIAAVQESQERRWDGLRRTRIPFLHVDTSQRQWGLYAQTILSHWRGLPLA